MQVDQECRRIATMQHRGSNITRAPSCMLCVACHLCVDGGPCHKVDVPCDNIRIYTLSLLQPHQQAGGPHVEHFQVSQELNGCFDVAGEQQQCQIEAHTPHLHHRVYCLLAATCVLTANRATEWLYNVVANRCAHCICYNSRMATGSCCSC